MPRKFICEYCDCPIYSDQPRCNNCGANNPYYNKYANAGSTGRQKKEYQPQPQPQQQNNNYNNASSYGKTGDGCADFDLSQQNGCVAILIVIGAIMFWPLTVIYLIYRAYMHSK